MNQKGRGTVDKQKTSVQSQFDKVIEELRELTRNQSFGNDLFTVVENIDHRGGDDIVLIMVIARQRSRAIYIDPVHFLLSYGRFPFQK